MFNRNEDPSKSPPADEFDETLRPTGRQQSPRHPADDFVRSAHAPLPQADEYLIDAAPPTGALLKADNPKLVLDAQKDGKVRMTCGTWEDARVLAPGEMLGLRREGTYWVVFRIGAKT